MRAAVARNGQLSIDDSPTRCPGRARCSCGLRVRDLRVRPARAALRRPAGRDRPRSRRADHVRPEPRLRHGPRVLGRGRRARARRPKASRSKRATSCARFPVALTADGRRSRRRVLERLQRRLRRADAAHRRHVHEGSERPRPPPRRAHRTDVGRPARGCARRRSRPTSPHSCSARVRSGSRLSRSCGASASRSIIVSDFSPRRRAVALAMGATARRRIPRATSPIDVWQREDGRRPLVVFDAIGVPGTLDEAMRMAPALARVCVVGSCMEARHDPAAAAAGEAAHDHLLVRVRPVRVRGHVAGDRRRRDRRQPDDHGNVRHRRRPGRVRGARPPRGARQDPRRAGRTRGAHPDLSAPAISLRRCALAASSDCS